MTSPAPAPLGRSVLVLVVATCGVAGLLGVVMPDLAALAGSVHTGTLDAAAFDLVMTQVAELALAACAVWLWSATLVITWDASRGRSAARRGVPDCLRRAVMAACGLTLAGGIATPADALEEDGPRTRSGLHSVDGLPLPDRATTTMHVSRIFARAAAGHRGGHGGHREVVVRPGDTLWELALRDLPPDADGRLVTERVREIHAANRAVIGADPDLILPGQRLRVPPPGPA